MVFTQVFGGTRDTTDPQRENQSAPLHPILKDIRCNYFCVTCNPTLYLCTAGRRYSIGQSKLAHSLTGGRGRLCRLPRRGETLKWGGYAPWLLVVVVVVVVVLVLVVVRRRLQPLLMLEMMLMRLWLLLWRWRLLLTGLHWLCWLLLWWQH